MLEAPRPLPVLGRPWFGWGGGASPLGTLPSPPPSRPHPLPCDPSTDCVAPGPQNVLCTHINTCVLCGYGHRLYIASILSNIYMLIYTVRARLGRAGDQGPPPPPPLGPARWGGSFSIQVYRQYNDGRTDAWGRPRPTKPAARPEPRAGQQCRHPLPPPSPPALPASLRSCVQRPLSATAFNG